VSNFPACRTMMWLLLVASVLMVATSHRAYSYAEPSILSPSWQFDFTFTNPRLIRVAVPGEELPQWYWYLPYTVSNHTGEDRLWVPSFVIFTDRGEVLEAGKGVSPVVYTAIAEQLKNELLESPIQAIGKLLQGKDNARDSVAIWPASSQDVDAMTLFVGGLSGETQTVTDPASGEDLIVRKTLMLKFITPGDQAPGPHQPVQFKGKSWVMR
jgi:hypothetical protein